MTPLRATLTAAAIASVLATGAFVAGLRVSDGTPSERFGELTSTAEELADGAAVSISDDELARAAIRGMLDALDDPYAAVLSPRQRRQVDDLLGGSIVGIGVWLDRDRAGLRVTSIVEGTPASRSGLRVEDVITAIDGHPTRGLTIDEAARFIRGPIGTEVELVIQRGELQRTLRLERARIQISDVQSRMLEGEIGYARLLQFGRGAANELRGALQRLLNGEAGGIVLDLRDNVGGLADEAVRVASLFLDGGVVARIREPGGPEQTLRTRGAPFPRFPLVVLVDGGTASAAELVAGALKDRGRATLVGTRTFGKGSVLTVADLHADRRIQYTSAFFYTPAGRPIEEVGIVPDLEVLPGGPEDAQLDRAVQVLRG